MLRVSNVLSTGKLLMTVAEQAKVYVNGEYVSGKLELMHGDRLFSQHISVH